MKNSNSERKKKKRGFSKIQKKFKIQKIIKKGKQKYSQTYFIYFRSSLNKMASEYFLCYNHSFMHIKMTILKYFQLIYNYVYVELFGSDMSILPLT